MKKVASLGSGKTTKSKEKSKIVIELRRQFPEFSTIKWLKIIDLPKSSFYEWLEKLEEINVKDKNDTKLIKEIVDDSKGTYGYRRVTIAMRNKGIFINHKRVLRLMKKNDLLCNKYTRRSRGYSSFKGEIGKIADNKINRDFKASSMYEKWVTDVTEFRIPGIDKKLYLSPIMDL